MADVPRRESLSRPQDDAGLPADATKDNRGLLCLRFDIADAARILSSVAQPCTAGSAVEQSKLKRTGVERTSREAN
jgi:hypothetical protein